MQDGGGGVFERAAGRLATLSVLMMLLLVMVLLFMLFSKSGDVTTGVTGDAAVERRSSALTSSAREARTAA